MPDPVGRGASSGTGGSRRYANFESPSQNPIIKELSNKDDVVAKMLEAEAKVRKELEAEGRSLTIDEAKRRVRQGMKPKEESVSSEVIENPTDPETIKAQQVAAETAKKLDQIARDLVKERPSLKGRITQGPIGSSS